ncbi:MAG TPA: AraC family transcriptional regulator [Mobilitalea sp.]|nr:AraC family transcriptional regulator [Mobilitalea sp.]
MDQSIYPIGGNERKLPVYLVGIGLNDYQYHATRNNGYYYPQIIYTTRGKGCIRFDDKEYILTTDYCFYLPAYYPHEYFTVGDMWETHWVTFDGFACSEILNQLGFTTALVKKLSDISKLESLFKKMFVTLKSDQLYGDFTCAGLIYQYIIEASRVFFDKDASDNSDRSRILMPVLNYIDENLIRDISLDMLCKIAKVSPQHLCRVFKESLNLRPVEYITKKRIAKAKELLINSELSITDISQRVGYPDQSYFGSVFKKYEFISPSEYRKNKSSLKTD